MSNKYIRNIDEESLARQIDEVRRKNCNCDQGCKGCPWALPEGKCLLITAENQISEKYHERLKNLMRHYAKVSGLLLSLKSMTTANGNKVEPCGNGWQYYLIRDSGALIQFPVKTALDLAKTVEELDGE